MKIVYVKSGTKEGTYCISIETENGKEKFNVTNTEYARCGAPSKGEEIDGEIFAKIQKYHQYHKAVGKALSILSYGDNNEKTLLKKLRMAGYSYDVARAAVADMVNLGYVNEREQLRRLIQLEANGKLHGPNVIFRKLLSKGYSTQDVREVMEELVEEGEISFKKNAKLLIEKKLPEGANALEMQTLLYKNGYKV